LRSTHINAMRGRADGETRHAVQFTPDLTVLKFYDVGVSVALLLT
jgi:hypothetical protein